MKKPQKLLRKPKLPKPAKVKLPFRRTPKSAEEKFNDALTNVQRITNDTVADHREEVLSSARKYIYPLQHSKHRVVRISLVLLAVVIIGFFAVTGLSLYKFQATSGFVYDVTRVIPFPVAKAGGNWVSYESYLFELRHNTHYYQTQQQADFSTKDGKAQLTRLKQQAMAQVVQDAYVKQLARQNGVTVSDQAVDNEVTLLQTENRLGNSDRVFREVLNEFWGWNEADFKRELKQQLLQQAVVAKLDTATDNRARAALNQLQNGTIFATLASQVSDDAATKAAGGQYPAAITVSDSNIPPAVTAELFMLKPGQTSGIINTGYTLEIVRVIDASGGSLHAAHIQFTFQPITTYTKPLQAKEPPHAYINVKP
jgi:parvulin-like peptidyl-prolyl isomerase